MTHLSVPRLLRRHGHLVRKSLRLPYPFIVGKKECSILKYRAPNGSAKLVAFESWNPARIEKVPRIQCAIPDELVSAAVKLVGSRARNRVHHTAGRLAILRRVVTGQHREFLDGVDAEAPSQDAAGRTVGVIVEADAIQTIVVLLGPGAGDGQLLSEAAVSALRARREVRLRLDPIHSGLQRCQVRPTAAVQRQLADCLRIPHRAALPALYMHVATSTHPPTH